MSRSYKKPFVIQDRAERYKKLLKTLFNRRVRYLNRVDLNRLYLIEEKPIPSGKAFRKVSDTWDIKEYSWYVPNDPTVCRK